MSDFPRGVPTTRAWLDRKGFVGMFALWEADALVGKSEKFIKGKFSSTHEDQERAEILCGLLSTARDLAQGNYLSFSIYLSIYLSIY